MSEYILETENLTKKYKNKTIVNKLNLKIKKGEIYGLLGKNGTGKTTTMCMITQLSKKNNGTIKLFGENIEENPEIFHRIGSLIEYPGFYENLTGYENLKYFQLIKSKFNKDKLEDALKIVGLFENKDEYAKKYSMGMKQRLAIATAIINEPDLLILDEPINGLDPQGIIDIRKFLKKLSTEHEMTIIISSHILSEIEQIADRIGIINNGKLIEELNIHQLKEKLYKYTEITVDKVEKSYAIINEKFDIHCTFKGNNIYIKNKEAIPDIIHELTKNQIKIYSIIPIIENLEEYFINTTTNELIKESEKLCLT